MLLINVSNFDTFLKLRGRTCPEKFGKLHTQVSKLCKKIILNKKKSVILNSKHIHSTTTKYVKLLDFIAKSIFGIHNCPVASQDFYRVLADVQTFLHYLKNFLIHLRIYLPLNDSKLAEP